ncbi:TSN7 protein, partial [Polypterus senegalus]
MDLGVLMHSPAGYYGGCQGTLQGGPETSVCLIARKYFPVKGTEEMTYFRAEEKECYKVTWTEGQKHFRVKKYKRTVGDSSRVILLAVGVWGKVSLEGYFSLVTDQSTNAPYVLIGTGAIIVIFGLFGCFATCRGSPWMLKLYAMFLSLVFLSELVAGISGFLFRHEIKAVVTNKYGEALENYNASSRQSSAVDNIQFNLKCCGATNFTDWEKTKYFLQAGIPKSCCIQVDQCSSDALKNITMAEKVVHNKGCINFITNLMESNLGVIAGISFGIAFFQVVTANKSLFHALYSVHLIVFPIV